MEQVLTIIHSFNLSPFLIGSNPPANSSKTTTGAYHICMMPVLYNRFNGINHDLAVVREGTFL